jgi:hypothetical protein
MLLYQHADLKQAKALVNLRHKVGVVVVVVVVVFTSWLFFEILRIQLQDSRNIDNLCTETGFQTTLL